eukprot:1734552-Amphidinium_carterae.1
MSVGVWITARAGEQRYGNNTVSSGGQSLGPVRLPATAIWPQQVQQQLRTCAHELVQSCVPRADATPNNWQIAFAGRFWTQAVKTQRTFGV